MMRVFQGTGLVGRRFALGLMTVVASGLLGWVGGSEAEAREASSSSDRETVELFAAIEAGDVEVTVIPHRSERVTLQVANKTERPLSIQVPEALAAGPVLAQLPLFGNQNNQSANQNQNAPQSVGFPGMSNGQNGQNGQQGGQNPFGMNAGFFNVPAGKVIKVKLPATCLEFGKREPNSRIAYELKPLEQVTEREEVVTILSMIGRQEVSRRIGQLAIWHIANGTEWSKLARLESDRIGGLVTMQYSSSEIQKAQALVKKLEEGKQTVGSAAASMR
jgi:hypothetical protein